MYRTISRMVAAIIGIAIVISLFIEQKTGPLDVATSRPAAPVTASPIEAKSGRAAADTSQSTAVGQPRRTGAGGEGFGSAASGSETLTADARGHFVAPIDINGVRIATLVDTGATFVAFSAEDAERAGIRPGRAAFRTRIATANGDVMAANVRIDRMRLGSIELQDVDAAVMPEGAMAGTLLGMSFLKRLSGVQFEQGRLLLRR